MPKQVSLLMLTLLGWLAFRCAVTLWFCNSEYQAYVLAFVVVAVWPDIFVCKWLAQRSQIIMERVRLGGLNCTGAHAAFLGGLAISVLASPFCVAAVSICSESAAGARSGFYGTVSIEEAIALPDDYCFEAPEAAAYIWYLGAVEYTVTRRVEKFYYAAPFESATWDKTKEVRIWAIVDEHELSEGALTTNRVACPVSSRNMHYSAFRTAVDNAEERFDLKSAENAILVRLIDSTEQSPGFYGSPTFWIVLLYGAGAIPALLFPLLFALARRDTKNHSEEETIVESTCAIDSLATITARFTSPKIAAATRRRFWLGWHVVSFIPLAVFIVAWLPDFLSLLLVLLIPAVELWLLLRAFPEPETRQSARMAVVCLMPLAMLFALLLVNVSKFGMNEASSYDANRTLLDVDMTQETTIVRVPENFQLRGEASGVYWAPNHETKTWRVIPLLPASETMDQPIKYWVKNNDRLDSRLQEQPLRYVRADQRRTSFQYRQAIADAEYHHEITAAESAIFLEPITDPAKQSQDAIGFIVLGFLGVFLSWATCAMYWPISRSK
ncbi:MAG: hypothetical protein JNL67_08140 [Planctomycetaceae bacterium]|nr:hypothetical protein [Planctomycetaceae bacterium]